MVANAFVIQKAICADLFAQARIPTIAACVVYHAHHNCQTLHCCVSLSRTHWHASQHHERGKRDQPRIAQQNRFPLVPRSIIRPGSNYHVLWATIAEREQQRRQKIAQLARDDQEIAEAEERHVLRRHQAMLASTKRSRNKGFLSEFHAPRYNCTCV